MFLYLYTNYAQKYNINCWKNMYTLKDNGFVRSEMHYFLHSSIKTFRFLKEIVLLALTNILNNVDMSRYYDHSLCNRNNAYLEIRKKKSHIKTQTGRCTEKREQYL